MKNGKWKRITEKPLRINPSLVPGGRACLRYFCQKEKELVGNVHKSLVDKIEEERLKVLAEVMELGGTSRGHKGALCTLVSLGLKKDLTLKFIEHYSIQNKVIHMNNCCVRVLSFNSHSLEAMVQRKANTSAGIERVMVKLWEKNISLIRGQPKKRYECDI